LASELKPISLAGFLKKRICPIISVTSDMGRLRKTLTYLLTYLKGQHSCRMVKLLNYCSEKLVGNIATHKLKVLLSIWL